MKTKEQTADLLNKIYDKIAEDLKHSRLEQWETDDGDKYPLLDFLSKEATIKEGLSEINNIVEQIDINDLLKEYASQNQSVSDEDIKRAGMIEEGLGDKYIKGIHYSNDWIGGAKAMKYGEIKPLK